MALSTSFIWSASRVPPTLMHLRDDASAAQRAADPSGLGCVVLPRPENRLAIGRGGAHAFPVRVRVFSRERENIGQEGFDALVHRTFRPGSLRASPCGSVEARLQAGKDYQWLLPACQGLSDAGRDTAPRFSRLRRVVSVADVEAGARSRFERPGRREAAGGLA